MSLTYSMPEGKNNSPKTTLSSAITALDTSITVDDVSKLNTGNIGSTETYNVATLGTGDGAEVVKITAVSGNTLTVARGQFGTTASVWAAGTDVYRAFTKHDHDNLRGNISYLDSAKLDTTGNGSSVTATFTAADTRANITTGSTLATIFGKLSKWYSDFKALAWKDKVASGDFESGAVSTGDIADDAVTSAKIADSTITSGNLADDAVTTDKIDDGAVTAGKLASESVTAAKIPDGEITRAKLASGVIHDIASGGTANQVIKKTSATDYDYTWSNVNWGEIGGTISNQTDLGTMAAIDDAPNNTNEYVRKGGAWVVNSGGSAASVTWGNIGGTLSSQADLNTALTAKANSADLGDLAELDSADLASNVTGTLPLANGGTGSASASGARTNLGITDIAVRPDYDYGTTDKEAGTSSLDTGKLYFYYS